MATDTDEGSWGSSLWGVSEWGGGDEFDAGLLVSALALSENVVQIGFSHALYFSGMEDANDAADPAHFTIVPVTGSIGSDGQPARAVSVILVEEASESDAAGDALYLLTLDRAMSPYPAQYRLAFTGLSSADQSQQLVDAEMLFYAVANTPAAATPDVAVPSRDFANPQSLQGAIGSNLPNPADPSVLGTYSADATGDYASDDAPTGFKKRCYRRLITRKNRFVHLPGYGIDITSYGKKLASAAVRAQLATEIELQLGLEPEALAVRASIIPDPKNNGSVRVPILIKTRNGAYVKMNPAFPVG